VEAVLDDIEFQISIQLLPLPFHLSIDFLADVLVRTHNVFAACVLAYFFVVVDEPVTCQLEEGNSDRDAHQNGRETRGDLLLADLGDEDPDRGGRNSCHTVLEGVRLNLNLEYNRMGFFIFLVVYDVLLEEVEESLEDKHIFLLYKLPYSLSGEDLFIFGDHLHKTFGLFFVLLSDLVVALELEV
jgi:hypothetical protein